MGPSAEIRSLLPADSSSLQDAVVAAGRRVDDAPPQEAVADGIGSGTAATGEVSLPPAIARQLYLSHFLSTWNSRVFEFGAVLYLASVFPQNLLPMSAYALARGAAAAFFSPAVGRYIDTSNRLWVVRLSIVLQRLVVAVSCVVFWCLATGRLIPHAAESWSLVLLAALACVEKLCSVMNLVSVERDWVVVIAQDSEPALRVLNSQMRRIDLVCKLAGPFAIALVDAISTEVAILVNLAMNTGSVVAEYYAIVRVYKMVPELQRLKIANRNVSESTGSEARGFPRRWWQPKEIMLTTLQGLSFYIHHGAFLPSFAGAVLYFTVISFAGQMITYLLSVGYSSIHIGIARAASVAFEMSATWLAPVVMSRIGPIRTGIWFINWQMLCLAGAASIFWGANSPTVAASGLVGGTILSRVGLWGFDLSAQIIVQQEVDPECRGSFSSVEVSWQNAFELCSYCTTVVFSRPEQFHWPVLMSCVAVFTAGGVYATFARSRRGHLVHFSKCIDPKGRRTLSEPSYATLVQSNGI